MKQIIHIITDDPVQQNKFRAMNFDGLKESLVILPLLQTTIEGKMDYTKRKWYFKIIIEDDGEVVVKKSYD